MPRQAINADRARQLRAKGLTWPMVATVLTAEARRRPAFLTESIQRAVRDYYGTSRVPSRVRGPV